MTYRFRTKSAGDVLMLDADGAAVLAAMGLTPGPKGIIEPPAMPAAFRAIETAVARDAAAASGTADGEEAEAAVSLRQRAWPLVEMMRRAHRANEPIVWGV